MATHCSTAPCALRASVVNPTPATLEEMQAAGLRYLQFADLARAGLVNSRETLRRWMNEGRFPKPIYPENQSPRWLVSELLEWERALLEQRNAA